LTCIILWIFIYIPIISYHLHKYRKRGTNIVYLLRYSNITVIQSILYIIKLILGVYSLASAVTIYGHASFETKIANGVIAYNAAFFLYCFVWKFWLLRYNVMLNNIVLNGEWKLIINKDHLAKNSFYQKYKRTCGNTRCTMYVWMALAIITTTLYVFGNIVYDFYTPTSGEEQDPFLKEIYSGWDYVIPFILLLIIYYKTPQFEDNFYIHTEMKLLFICLCVQYLVYYGNLTLLFLLQPDDKTLDVMWTVGTQIIYFVQLCTVLISTYWVNSKCDDIISAHRYIISKIPTNLNLNLEQMHCIEIQPSIPKTKVSHEEDDEVTTPIVRARTDTFDEDESDHLTLCDLLSSNKTFNAFINHLSREYSIECLLSLTEMIQFREYMIAKHFSKGFDADKLRLQLAPDIPQSFIVANKNWDDKEKAYLLYTKYIRSGAELQINISAEQRMRYDQLMGNYQCFMENGTVSNMELVKLFDGCCTQMIYLMIDARKRFQRTAVYTKLHRASLHLHK